MQLTVDSWHSASGSQPLAVGSWRTHLWKDSGVLGFQRASEGRTLHRTLVDEEHQGASLAAVPTENKRVEVD